MALSTPLKIIIVVSIVIIIIIVSIFTISSLRKGESEEEEFKKIMEMEEEEKITTPITHDWNIREKPTFIKYDKDELIGNYETPDPDLNGEYCFDLCNNNPNCTAYLFNDETKCKLLKKKNPEFVQNVNPQGKWGGGIKY